MHSDCTDRRDPGLAASLQVSPTSDTCQSVAILMNRRHWCFRSTCLPSVDVTHTVVHGTLASRADLLPDAVMYALDSDPFKITKCILVNTPFFTGTRGHCRGLICRWSKHFDASLSKSLESIDLNNRSDTQLSLVWKNQCDSKRYLYPAQP